MHTRIKVKDLNLRQWDWLQENVLVEYQFAPFEPRACVEFELTPDLNTRHVEMPIPAFTGLMMVLQSLGLATVAEAVLSETPGTGTDGVYQVGQGNGAGWND
jgi:hypothetical protein